MPFCHLCQKVFRTEEALLQHRGDSPTHKQTDCTLCTKTFPTAEALAQHTRDSPAHKAPPTTPICTPCNRAFISADALAAHIQDSPLHNPRSTSTGAGGVTATPSSSFPPSSITTDPAGENTHQPLGYPLAALPHPTTMMTPTPAPTTTTSKTTKTTLPCTLCPRSKFASPAALAQHMRDAPAHGGYGNQYAGKAGGLAAAAAAAEGDGGVGMTSSSSKRCDSLLGAGDDGGYEGEEEEEEEGGAGGSGYCDSGIGGVSVGESASEMGLRQEGVRRVEGGGRRVEKGVGRVLLEGLEAMKDEDGEEEEEEVKLLVKLLLRRLRLV
ncbi:hypothetical protein SLS54_007175 [Diplodia seriata]|uniref:C2H2-type domain-containing protein n=1 Tax=Diplodia seriata TaxID=420778 RepID=A0A1S8BK59_9PEZI|nr:hypothetical protein BK809_0007929 [Diplodia seriata]